MEKKGGELEIGFDGYRLIAIRINQSREGQIVAEVEWLLKRSTYVTHPWTPSPLSFSWLDSETHLSLIQLWLLAKQLKPDKTSNISFQPLQRGPVLTPWLPTHSISSCKSKWETETGTPTSATTLCSSE